MALRGDLHSRAVAWLKVIFPLAALAILSTLFLLSKTVDPTTTIPFTTINLEERAREQQITAPHFAGATDNGDFIAFSAKSARPDPDHANRAFGHEISARIDLTSGATITFTAEGGIIDEAADSAELRGGVIVNSSTGYTIRTERLISGMREIRAQTTGPIDGEGRPGRFSAGKMTLTTDPETKDVHLVFTNGVKLIYDPAKSRETNKE